MLRKPWGVFIFSAVLLTVVILVQNRRLFHEPLLEWGDPAANSLLVGEAKHGRLLVGNYSRLHFNHPGPGIFYVMAGAEIVLYDLSGFVPAPWNAQMLGAILLDGLLLSIVLAVLASHWRSSLATLAALAVLLAYFTWHGALTSTWMPHVYFAIFLALVVSAASVAAGQAWHLPALALAGGLAVHGHVCFVSFVVPLALFALVGLLWKHEWRWRMLLREQRKPLIRFALVLALFVLPIAVHTIAHYPGEIGKYIAYARSPRAGGHKLRKAVDFALRCAVVASDCNRKIPASKVVIPVLAVLMMLTLPWRREQAARGMSRALLGAIGVAVASFLFYAVKGVDDLNATYVGIFFGSVLLVGFVLAAMNVCRFLEARTVTRIAAVALMIPCLVYLVSAGCFRNDDRGCPFAVAGVAQLEKHPGWKCSTIVCKLEDEGCWPTAVSFLLRMERQGKRVYVANPELEFVLTRRLTQVPAEALSDAWHLDFVHTGHERGRVLLADRELTIQEQSSLAGGVEERTTVKTGGQ